MAGAVLTHNAFEAFEAKRNSDPTSLKPVDAYKAIIDELATTHSHSVRATRVARNVPFLETATDAKYNALTNTLTPVQRQLLADMLDEEHIGGIHDVLACLTWFILTREVGLTFRGEPMQVELSGSGLHGDYIGRRDNWAWPADEDPAPAD